MKHRVKSSKAECLLIMVALLSMGCGEDRANSAWSTDSEATLSSSLISSEDTFAPKIGAVHIEDALTLAIHFTEAVNRKSANEILNYHVVSTVDGPLTLQTAIRDESTKNIVRLTVVAPLMPIEHNLLVSGVKDLSQNIMEQTKLNFTPHTKIAFVTASAYPGKLINSLDDADALCQQEANTAGLSGQFLAWLSSSTTSAIDRFLSSSGGWLLRNGTVFLPYSESLGTTTPWAPFSVTAKGDTIEEQVYAWTDTLSSGVSAGMSCFPWQDESPLNDFTMGGNPMILSSWTQGALISCSGDFHLYCLQSGFGPALDNML